MSRRSRPPLGRRLNQRVEAELKTLTDCLRAFLAEGDVEAARGIVPTLTRRWPDTEEARYWARVLALPIVTSEPGVPPRSLDGELDWIEENADQYPDHWLAVSGSQLVEADRDLAGLLAKLRRKPEAARSVIFFEPSSPK